MSLRAGRLSHCGAAMLYSSTASRHTSQVWWFEESESPVTAVHFCSFELGPKQIPSDCRRGGTDASTGSFSDEKGVGRRSSNIQSLALQLYLNNGRHCWQRKRLAIELKPIQSKCPPSSRSCIFQKQKGFACFMQYLDRTRDKGGNSFHLSTTKLHQ